MSALNGNKIDRYGIRAPHYYSASSALVHSAYSDDETMCATVSPRTDGFGYVIETWHEDVGLVTYWTTPDLADAVEFADDVAASKWGTP